MAGLTAPYKCPFTLTGEIFQLISSIAFKAGRLSLMGEKKVTLEDNIESLKIALTYEGVNFSLSEKRGLTRGEQLPMHKEALPLLKIYNRLSKIDIHHGEIVALFEEAAFPEGVPNRMGRTAAKIDHPLPIAAKIEGLMKSLWKYTSGKSIHPLITASIAYFEIMAIAPYSSRNALLADLVFKGLVSEYCPSLLSSTLEKNLYKNKEKEEKAFRLTMEKEDSSKFVVYLLNIVSLTLDNLSRSAVIQRKKTSPLLEKLLSRMESDKGYSAMELCALLGLKSRLGLSKNYLKPALEAKLIYMSNPLVPTDRNQRYFKKEQ